MKPEASFWPWTANALVMAMPLAARVEMLVVARPNSLRLSRQPVQVAIRPQTPAAHTIVPVDSSAQLRVAARLDHAARG